MKSHRYGVLIGVFVLAVSVGVFIGAASAQKSQKSQPSQSSAPAQASQPSSPSAQTAANAQQQEGANGPLTIKTLSYNEANAAVQAAMKKAQSIGINEDIAVVDAGGSLKAFARMDNAWLGSIEISERKAKTARYFDMATGDLGKKAEPGQPLYGIQTIPPSVIFAGGTPIKSADGQVIGAIGASGSTPDNDKQVAQAGAQAVH